MKIILASTSPRRKHLLEEAGFSLECVAPGVEEVEGGMFSPEDMAIENATRKAMAVASRRPGEVVLAADTVVWRKGKFFGKPASMEAAEKMLAELSGQSHQVITGVAIAFPKRNFVRFAETSLVIFCPLHETEIREYLKEIQPLDKAGAYAAQMDGGRVVKQIKGSVSNVVGLPVERVKECLQAWEKTESPSDSWAG